jgi:hypothetical protein
MQAASNSSTFEGLSFPVLFAQSHQAWHFFFGNFYFFPTPARELSKNLWIFHGLFADPVIHGGLASFCSFISKSWKYF